MYESPIDVFVTQMNIKRNRAIEKEVLTAVQGVGVNVNKEELEKALQYDRGQYKKGYADGVKEFADRLKKEAEKVCIDREGDFVEADNEIYDTVADWCKETSYNLVKEMVGDKNYEG